MELTQKSEQSTLWTESVKLYRRYHDKSFVETLSQQKPDSEQNSEKNPIFEKISGLAGIVLKRLTDEEIVSKTDAETIQSTLTELSSDIAADRKKTALFNLLIDIAVPLVTKYLLSKSQQQKNTGGLISDVQQI